MRMYPHISKNGFWEEDFKYIFLCEHSKPHWAPTLPYPSLSLPAKWFSRKLYNKIPTNFQYFKFIFPSKRASCMDLHLNKNEFHNSGRGFCGLNHHSFFPSPRVGIKRKSLEKLAFSLHIWPHSRGHWCTSLLSW